MSPRAAARLVTLGFQEVYDYEGGKLDWLGAGLPREGEDAGKLTVGDVARPNIPTAHLGDGAYSVLKLMARGDWPQAVVVDEAGVLLGRLRKSRLSEAPNDLVEVLMDEGPSTARANEDLSETTKGMVEGGVNFLLVSTPEGFPLGLLFREDARARLDAVGRTIAASDRRSGSINPVVERHTGLCSTLIASLDR